MSGSPAIKVRAADDVFRSSVSCGREKLSAGANPQNTLKENIRLLLIYLLKCKYFLNITFYLTKYYPILDCLSVTTRHLKLSNLSSSFIIMRGTMAKAASRRTRLYNSRIFFSLTHTHTHTHTHTRTLLLL